MHHDQSLNRSAASATLHCLTGCATGEVLGMIITTAFSLSNVLNIVISVILSFVFGYGLTMRSVLRSGVSLQRAGRLALASDTASIATMELADNGFILIVPGAISAGITTALFWISLVVSIVAAFAAAFPINRWLISRGKGHAVVHDLHAAH